MTRSKHTEILIVGGGLAGLTAGIHLSQQGFSVLLIEKYAYPHHKVCGEYVSNEVLPYLQQLGVDPLAEGAKKIDSFQISSQNGQQISTNLPLGGFGISRYHLDNILYKNLLETAEVSIDTVTAISFTYSTAEALGGKRSEMFEIETHKGNQYTADYVLGAFGKRSNLDLQWKRPFTKLPAQWLGVKAHYAFDMPENVVALHNFQGGYCGLSKTESGAVNACYLASYDSFKKHKDIYVFQEKVLSQNPFLNAFFKKAELLFVKPLTISQISFSEKSAVQNHILMLGDSAGLIHPLCGNGMAMAIHSAKLVSEILLQGKQEHFNRETIELTYTSQWQATFSKRLQTGKTIQKLLLKPAAADIGFKVAKLFPGIVPRIIKKTHGEVLL